MPRIFYLGQFLTADEKRWQANVAGFTNKLSQGRIGELVQQPHPGITTQWFAASAVFNTNWAIRKLPLVLWQCVLLAIIGYVFWRLSGFLPAFLITLLLALNPQLIAHTRIYAMDSLLAQFCLLSLGLLLLWQKTRANHYLFMTGFATAAAVLSKLPGIILVPVITILFFCWQGVSKNTIKTWSLWLAGFLVGLCLILPSFLVNPMSVIGDFSEFFRSNEYNDVHQGTPFYYFSTLAFFSTPLEMMALTVLITTIATKRKLPYWREASTFALFGIAFFIMMSLGLKKGDRYILPIFLILDAMAVYVIAWLINNNTKRIWWVRTVLVVMAFMLAGQVVDVARLNTYVLAYVNPLTKPFLHDRRLGWGEGLDLVAQYLNQKKDSKSLTVASYYPVEFSYRFLGKVKPIHEWETNDVNYVVIYRAMFERGQDSWEQDVLNHFQNKQPEKIISLNGIKYAWIYKPD